MKRRLVFALPFVVTAACDRSSHPPTTPHEDDVADEPPVSRTEPAPASPAPEPVRPPDELVKILKPLTSDRTIEDVCRHARCNPPPPYKPQKPKEIDVTMVRIEAMQRVPAGTRVRLDRAGRGMESWRADFVDGHGDELGACEIVAWDFHQLECVTSLAPEQLVDRGRTLKARLTPSPEQIAAVESQIRNWIEPGSGRGRIIGVQVEGDGVVVVVGIGTNQGIDPRSKAHIVDSNGKLVTGGECTVIRIDERTVKCRAKLTPDQIKTHAFAQLTPP